MRTEPEPRLDVLPDVEAVAVHAAQALAGMLQTAVAERGRAALAVSGGRTPQRMLERLAEQALPWEHIDLFQVDERVAPGGHPDRNVVTIERAFAPLIERHPERFHWMPVEAPDLSAAAQRYASALHAVVGRGGALDAVHLGLGADGHTASVFPGSPLLGVEDQDVAIAPRQQGRERMTLTLPALNRARSIVWLVTGAEKQTVLAGLCNGDRALVASRVRREGAVIVADAAAAARAAS